MTSHDPKKSISTSNDFCSIQSSQNGGFWQKMPIFDQKWREIDNLLQSRCNQLWLDPETVKNDLKWPLMTLQNLKILIGSGNVTVNISKILTPGVGRLGILNKRVLSWTNVKKNFQIVNCNWPRTNHSWAQSKRRWPWNRQKIQN